MPKVKLTVIMAAYNEEKNIASAIDACIKLLKENTQGYELLVFDDGSSDRTGFIADQKAKNDPGVKVIHYGVNKGPGQIVRDAIRMATQDYLTWFPGDHSVDENFMQIVIGAIGQADIVCAYIANPRSRPFIRRPLSAIFTFLFNSLFGLHLRYYNGASVFPVNLLRSIEIKSDRYSFFAEIFVRLLRSGYSYVEVPFYHKPDPATRTKAFSLRNFYHLTRTIFILIRDIYFLHQPKGRKDPR